MWNVLFVIAGDKTEFNDFVLKNVDSDRYRRTNFIWVGGPEAFRGQQNPNGICIGTWKDRLDIDVILNRLLVTCKDQSKFDRVLELGMTLAEYRKIRIQNTI